MNMMNKLKRIIRGVLVALRLKRRASFELRWSKTQPVPGKLKNGDLVVIGVEGQYQKWACFQCPCGCGNQLRLCLSASESPSWQVKVNEVGLASLHPSVRQIKGCYSHFWLRDGEIEWCHDTGLPFQAAESFSGY